MRDDAMNRLKAKRGEQLPQSKLTAADVRLILAAVTERDRLKREAAALTNAQLAEEFGVHVRTIDRITTGENWSHVAC